MDNSEVQPSISVIIPVHSGCDGFRRCLAAVARNVPAPAETLVVTDGDEGQAKAVAEEFGARVIVLAQRGGPARARNHGARAARGEILFFVDADVVLPPDAVRRVAEAFRRQPELAAVFGSYDDAPTEANFLSQYKNLLHHYVHQTGREQAGTFWGACGAIRREDFFAAGGFDERYSRPCVEDIDLGYRLVRLGRPIRQCKGLQVKHMKRWSAISLVVTDFRDRALPWTELILRYRGFINDLNLRHASRVSVGLSCMLPAALAVSFWWPPALIAAAALAVGLLGLNARVYAFFVRNRGPWFALRVIPWHWFYYAYSGLAFAIGLGRHLARRRPSIPEPGRQERVRYSASGKG